MKIIPNISVIIPTYNREKYITNAINSILSQTYKDYEIIVIDDGSTDNTRDILEQYGNKIKYIYQRNAGVSAARNTGISIAKGNWIAFLDSDDEWMPEKLSLQMENINQNPDICLHATNAIIQIDDNKKTTLFNFTGISEYLNQNNTIIDRPLNYQINYGLARIQCSIVKREILNNKNIFDTQLSIYEDQDLMCRIALKGSWGIYKIPLVEIFRREETTDNLSKQRINKSIDSNKSLIYLYTKLLNNVNLANNERNLVEDTLNLTMSMLGKEYLKISQKFEARTLLKKVYCNKKNIKSFIFYIISILPNFPSRHIIKIIFNKN